jgi:hypothetical protein
MGRCVNIIDCVFDHCELQAGGDDVQGGAIHLEDHGSRQTSTISGSFFISCRAAGGRGGAMWFSSPHNISLMNSCGCHCSSGSGGFGYLERGSFDFVGNSLYNNAITEASGGDFVFAILVAPIISETNCSSSTAGNVVVANWESGVGGADGGSWTYGIFHLIGGQHVLAANRNSLLLRCAFSSCSCSQAMLFARADAVWNLEECTFKGNTAANTFRTAYDRVTYKALRCYSDKTFTTNWEGRTVTYTNVDFVLMEREGFVYCLSEVHRVVESVGEFG